MYDDLDLDWSALLSTNPADYKVADGQVRELQELYKDPYYYLTVGTK